ncbi:hypothetical protein CCAX7_17250 [Capsulimonas corticalis]|uniref:Uncharacterized protein n=1 Tax=Capsulimonas corticalis TaxID=2219043 RepID=A0A402D3W0_9BACT|nr:hypothetical protein [Capsulimonas corticalis]BDI29674.1 hypothetical protein CCAX7_17250 [Capsulimonas corticalis]
MGIAYNTSVDMTDGPNRNVSISMELKGAEQPNEILTPELLVALEEGVQSERTGREYTWEEAKQFARERRKAWTIVPDSLSA